MRKTIAFVLVAIATSAQAADPQLQAARNNDIVVTRLVALPAPAGEFERKPVSFSWALDPQAPVTSPAPFAAESREYWTQVEATELTRGLDLDTTGPGAVIRLSPVGQAGPADAGRLRLSRAGAAIAADRAFAHLASAEQLRDAGMEVTRGTAVAQLHPDLGAGRFRLQMDGASGRYLVHVFEPTSPYALRAGASRANLIVGDRIEVTARLERRGTAVAGGDVAGLLVAPSGKSYELAFADVGQGARRAVATVPADAGSEPGLWQVQVLAGASENGMRIQRDGRTAIAVAQPTARLGGSYRFDAARLEFAAPVQVGSPGRYALGATLFATGSDGVARPVLQAQSAAWFEPGQRQLTLAFDRTQLPAGYGAPFEVRQLDLKDQTRMGQLETRELAARIGAR